MSLWDSFRFAITILVINPFGIIVSLIGAAASINDLLKGTLPVSIGIIMVSIIAVLNIFAWTSYYFIRKEI